LFTKTLSPKNRIAENQHLEVLFKSTVGRCGTLTRNSVAVARKTRMRSVVAGRRRCKGGSFKVLRRRDPTGELTIKWAVEDRVSSLRKFIVR
jgi:hypothetical protein